MFHLLVVTRTSTGLVTIYVDNVNLTVITTSGTPAAGGNIYIGNRAAGNRAWDGFIGKVAIYNHIFTEQECANAYKDFLNSYPQSKEKYPNVINKPLDLSREKENGLVAAYNMIPNGNILVDISGNGKNGTISNCVSLKDGIKFISNKQSKITFAGAQVAYPSSISLRFKPGVINVSDRSIIGQGIGYPYIIFTNGILKCGWYSGSWYSKVSSSIALAQDKIYTITYTCAANEGKIYVNGVDVSTTGENVNVPTPVIFMADIGNNWYTDGTVYDVRFHNKILSLQEIRNYHNSFVQPTLVVDFSD